MSRLAQIRRRTDILNGTWSDDPPVSSNPEVLVGLPEMIDNFSCGDWVVYLNRLIFKEGKAKAREIMLQDFGHVGLFNFEFSTCELDCSFVKVVNSLDPDYLTALSSVYCGGTDIVEDVVGAGVGAAKVAKWVVPAAAIGAAAYYANKAGFFKGLKR